MNRRSKWRLYISYITLSLCLFMSISSVTDVLALESTSMKEIVLSLSLSLSLSICCSNKARLKKKVLAIIIIIFTIIIFLQLFIIQNLQRPAIQTAKCFLTPRVRNKKIIINKKSPKKHLL